MCPPRPAKDAGDCYFISGDKTWISNGTVADVAMVYATFDRGLKHRGIYAVVVETAQPGWHEVLEQLASLDYVQRIDESFAE